MIDARDAEKRAVMRKIRHAFADATRPNNENIVPNHLRDHWEASEAPQILEDANWEDVASNIIAFRGVGLLYLTPEALAYFLPGFLIGCLRDPVQADILFEYVMDNLTPPKLGDGDLVCWRDRFERFTQSLSLQQRRAVYDFIKFNCDERYEVVLGGDLRAVEFWKSFSQRRTEEH